MSKISEAADIFAEKYGFQVPYNGTNDFYDDKKVKSSYDGFIAGSEFMQKQYEEKLRWIPIEECFPLEKPFLMKNENKNIGDTFYIEYVGKYDIVNPDDIKKRTHWRPIFL